MKKLILSILVSALIIVSSTSYVAQASDKIIVPGDLGTPVNYNQIPQVGARQIPKFPSRVNSITFTDDNKMTVDVDGNIYEYDLAKTLNIYIKIRNFSGTADTCHIEYRKISKEELSDIWVNGIGGCYADHVDFLWFHKDNPGLDKDLNLYKNLSQIQMTFNINRQK